MEPDILKASSGSDHSPWLFEIDQVPSPATTADHVGIALHRRHVPEYLEGGRVEIDSLLPGFAVRQREHGIFQINMVPAQCENFIQTSTGEDQDSNRADDPGEETSTGFFLIQNAGQLRELLA